MSPATSQMAMLGLDCPGGGSVLPYLTTIRKQPTAATPATMAGHGVWGRNASRSPTMRTIHNVQPAVSEMPSRATIRRDETADRRRAALRCSSSAAAPEPTVQPATLTRVKGRSASHRTRLAAG